MTASADQLTNYAHARAALAHEAATADELRAALAGATAALRLAVGAGVRKTDAATLLGISRQALERWITEGRIRTVPSTTSTRALVDADHLAELLVEVERLRALGKDRAVITAAIHRLEQQDPKIQQQIDAMLGPGLEALKRGDVVPLVIPDSLGPED